MGDISISIYIYSYEPIICIMYLCIYRETYMYIKRSIIRNRSHDYGAQQVPRSAEWSSKLMTAKEMAVIRGARETRRAGVWVAPTWRQEKPESQLEGLQVGGILSLLGEGQPFYSTQAFQLTVWVSFPLWRAICIACLPI